MVTVRNMTGRGRHLNVSSFHPAVILVSLCEPSQPDPMMTTQTTIVRLVRVERIVIVFVGVAVLAVALLVAPGIPWVVAGGRGWS